jgi:predicted esterase
MTQRVVLLWVCSLALFAQDSPFSKKKSPDGVPEPAPQDPRPKLDAAAKSQLQKLFAEYLRAKWQDRQGILEQVEKIDQERAVTKADVDHFLKQIQSLDKNGPKHEGSTSGRVKFNHPEWKGEYVIQAGGGQGGKVALWLSLHGGGKGSGDPSGAPRLHGTGSAIHVYPAVLEKVEVAWNREQEDQYVIELVHALKRSFNVDTNRIYLVGHSMGAYGTWSIGTTHADQFAGLAAFAGGHFPEHTLANLKNTPIYFFHSTDDRQVGPKSDQRNNEVLKEFREKHGPYDFVYKEYADIGHMYPREGLGPIYSWLQGKVRKPYPKTVVHSPRRPYKRLMWWLKVPAQGEWGGGRNAARVENGNKIVIEEGCAGAEVFLHEKMGITLSKEMTVERNGTEVFKGRVPYSLAALLESFGQNRDPEHYYYAKIKLP